MYFYTLFHLHVFSKNTNNVTRTTLSNRPWKFQEFFFFFPSFGNLNLYIFIILILYLFFPLTSKRLIARCLVLHRISVPKWSLPRLFFAVKIPPYRNIVAHNVYNMIRIQSALFVVSKVILQMLHWWGNFPAIISFYVFLPAWSSS